MPYRNERTRDILRAPEPATPSPIFTAHLASGLVFIHPRYHMTDPFLIAANFPLSSRLKALRPTSRRSPKHRRLTPQACATSKIPSFHVTRILHDPSQVGSRSGPCLCWEHFYCIRAQSRHFSYVPSSFCFRPPAVHSSLSPFTLAQLASNVAVSASRWSTVRQLLRTCI